MASRPQPPQPYTLRTDTGEGAPSPGQKASRSDGPDNPLDGTFRGKTDNSAAGRHAPWLARQRFLLNARLQQLRFGQGQTQIGNLFESSGRMISMISVHRASPSAPVSTNRNAHLIIIPQPANS